MFSLQVTNPRLPRLKDRKPSSQIVVEEGDFIEMTVSDLEEASMELKEASMQLKETGALALLKRFQKATATSSTVETNLQ